MKNILLILSVLFLASCKSTEERVSDMNFKTITVHDCEYILAKAPQGDFGWVMSHKGNCSNPIHKCN